MSNLNSPAIKRGPLLASEMRRVTVMDPHGIQWPDTVPTQPAECCTELGADPDPYDGTALVRGLMSAIGITALLAGAVLVFA